MPILIWNISENKARKVKPYEENIEIGANDVLINAWETLVATSNGTYPTWRFQVLAGKCEQKNHPTPCPGCGETVRDAKGTLYSQSHVKILMSVCEKN